MKVAMKAGKKGPKKVPTIVVAHAGTKPKPSYKPVHYKGGRIYWSKSKAAWRVYLRAVDKVEVSVHLGADADAALVAKQWRKCLKAIEQDPRPIG